MKKKNIIIILIIYMFFSFINLQNTDLLVKQFLFYAATIFFIYFYKTDIVHKNIRLLYLLFNALLLYLLLFGKEINGSKSWLVLGTFLIQPSEFMKVILLIYLSFIATKYENYKIKCLIITLIPAILTFLEPDTGNVMFYFVTLLAVIFYKEGNTLSILKYGTALILLVIIFLTVYLNFTEEFIKVFGYSIYYRLDRVFSLFNNSSYQLNRALIGIGNAHLFGSDKIVSIPYQTTDFAFSYLTSNVGFIGILGFLLFNLCVNLYFIKAIRYNVGMNRSVVFSFIVMKITQETIHILMNIGLFPITGITLPFISYGGSSLLSYALILAYISKDNCSMVDSKDKVELGMEQGLHKLGEVWKVRLPQLLQAHLKEME